MKKFIYSLFTTVVILSNTYAGQVIGAWKLDEGKGSVIKDSSGNGNNGIFKGKWITRGSQTAILLDKNFIKFPPEATPQISKSSFTITAWVLPKKVEFQGKQKTIRILSAVGPDGFFVVDLEDGGKPQLEMGIKINDKWTYCRVTSNKKIEVEKWTKLTFTCDRENMKMKVCIDGTESAEAVLSNKFKETITGYNFTIGSVWHGFTGLINNVKIYKTILSNEEIKKQYAKESPHKSAIKLEVKKSHPEITPRIDLYAEFLKNTRCPVFKHTDSIKLWIKVKGWRHNDDTLRWSVLDWQDKLVDTGMIQVSRGRNPWTGSIKLGHYGAGYFQVHLHLKKANIRLAKAGSKPAGFMSYAVLPNIKPLPLAHVDDSRFGAQGYSRTGAEQGKYLIYDLGGMKWTYHYKRLFELEEKGKDTYKPILDPVKIKKQAALESKLGMCLFVDAHSIPKWMTKVPKGVSTEKWTRSATHYWSSYPPKDYNDYGKLIGKVAAEQAVLRKVNFPNQQHNYYEIHWEPDWHWKGTDEEFIKLYEYAHKAIKANDPDGLLLGANYGVLSVGNKHMKRLFHKGLGKYLDGIVTHTYFLPMLHNSPEQAELIYEMRKLKAMTDKYLPANAPIINSEWGISNTHSFGTTALQNPSVLNDEAAWFIRGHAIALGEGCRTTFFFYTVDPRVEGGLFYNLTAPYPKFGATHIAPKPVFSAVAAMTRLLEGTQNICAVDYLGPNVWGYFFDRNGENIAMLWSKDDKSRLVTVPCGSRAVTLYDPMGNPKKIKTKNGKLQVRLSANPIYIAGVSTAAMPAAKQPLCITIGQKANSKYSNKEYRLIINNGSKTIPCGTTKRLDLPQNIHPGLVLLSSVDQSNNYVKSQLLKLEPPVGLALKKADSNTVNVQLKNRLDKSVQGVLALSSAGKEFCKEQINLAGKQQKSLVLKLDNMPQTAASSSQVTATFTDSNGAKSSERLELESLFIIPKMTTTPNIDGNLLDLNLENFQTVDSSKAVHCHQSDEWQGPQDLSFRFTVKYDTRVLYFGVKVRDQFFLQEKKAVDSWSNDSVQIGVALKPQNNSWKIFHKFCFAVNSKNGKVLSYRHNGIPGLGPGNLNRNSIKFAFKRVGDESFYEVAIPWNQLDKSLTGPPADAKLGIGILVNDIDVGKLGPTKRKAMEAFGGMAVTEPAKLGKAILK